MPAKDFGFWFRKQLREKVLVLADIKEITGIPQATMHAHFHGERLPDPYNLDMYAVALNVTREEIYAVAQHSLDKKSHNENASKLKRAYRDLTKENKKALVVYAEEMLRIQSFRG